MVGARGLELGRVMGRLLLSAAGCLFLSQAAFGGLYCNDPTLVITSPGTVSDDMIIGDHLAISDLNVRIVASHTWVGDLTFTLEKIAGDGAAIVPLTLMDRPGVPDLGSEGCQLDDVNLLLDDEATNGAIENQCETPLGVNGPYTPDSALSAFDGVDIGGTWRLSISDAVSEDGGTLTDWCLITHSVLDVDGDGEVDALTDGLLIVRHRFGFTNGALINGAVNLMNCTRCTADDIDTYLDELP